LKKYYRIKIVKCLDAIVEAEDLNELVDLIRACNEGSKTYIHILEYRSGEFIDRGVIYRGLLRDLLRRIHGGST
jgi:hypothetical protein